MNADQAAGKPGPLAKALKNKHKAIALDFPEKLTVAQFMKASNVSLSSFNSLKQRKLH